MPAAGASAHNGRADAGTGDVRSVISGHGSCDAAQQRDTLASVDAAIARLEPVEQLLAQLVSAEQAQEDEGKGGTGVGREEREGAENGSQEQEQEQEQKPGQELNKPTCTGGAIGPSASAEGEAAAPALRRLRRDVMVTRLCGADSREQLGRLRNGWQKWRGIVRWCRYHWFSQRTRQFRLSRAMLLCSHARRAFFTRCLSRSWSRWAKVREKTKHPKAKFDRKMQFLRRLSVKCDTQMAGGSTRGGSKLAPSHPCT